MRNPFIHPSEKLKRSRGNVSKIKSTVKSENIGKGTTALYPGRRAKPLSAPCIPAFY